MNDTFNIRRFNLLVRKDLAENWKRYMLAILLMFGITSILFIWISTNFYEDMRSYVQPEYYKSPNYLSENLFVAGMILFLVYGCLSASWLMDPIRDKTRKTSYLTNPSSSFEKYIVRWGIQVALFLIIYIIIFFAADFIQWLVCTLRYPELNVRSIEISSLISIGNEYRGSIFRNWNQLFMAMSLYFFIQSLFVLGATFWQKNTFIKTFCAGFIISIVYITICGGFVYTLFDNGFRDFGNAFEHIIIRNHDNIDNIFIYIITTGATLFTVVNWVLSYFRFKETEITKRI